MLREFQLLSLNGSQELECSDPDVLIDDDIDAFVKNQVPNS